MKVKGKEKIERYSKWLLGKKDHDVVILFYDKLDKLRYGDDKEDIGVRGLAVHGKYLKKYIKEKRKEGEKYLKQCEDDSVLRYLDWLIDQDVPQGKGIIVYGSDDLERRTIWHEVSHIKTFVFCKEKGRDSEVETDIYAVVWAMIRGYSQVEKEFINKVKVNNLNRYRMLGFMEIYEKCKKQFERKKLDDDWKYKDRPDYLDNAAPPHEKLLIYAIKKHHNKKS